MRCRRSPAPQLKTTPQPKVPSTSILQLGFLAPPDAVDCPLWLEFLHQTFAGDAGLIRFLQQWHGYSLTGSTREHALLFGHGHGGNGKTVWLNTISNIMGDYCRTAAMDTFTAAKHDRHPTELAALKGARLVCASETEEGRAWSEVRIKQLTGGDRIAARLMRQDFFEFVPQFKLTVIGNNVPELHNVDDAARRRLNIVPFTQKPPVIDRNLEQKLRAEWPGILRWKIVGCLDWRENGLIRPDAVAASTAEYFSEQDLLSQWLEECCVQTDDGSQAKDTVASLMASWRNYAKAHGEDVGSSRRFVTSMRKRGFRSIRDVAGLRGRGLFGVKVRTQFYEGPRDDG
jgi:putative DNA primase/helicase